MNIGPQGALLALLNAALAVTLTARLWRGTDIHSLLATPKSPITGESIRIPIPADPANLDAIQQDALFYTTRRYYVMSAATVQIPRPDYRVSGTVMRAGGAVAFVVPNGSGATRRISIGDDLNGWTVRAIDSTRVVLRNGEAECEIGRSAGATLPAGNSSAGFSKVTVSAALGAPHGGGVRVLGGPGGGAGAVAAAGQSNLPRLYRPPPR
jgi:type II secretory pathway component PulC